MESIRKTMLTVIRNVFLLVCLMCCVPVYAEKVESPQDLRLLPKFCWGTQQVRDFSKDPHPIEYYVNRYGPTYHDFHHFCWGLIGVNRASQVQDKALRMMKLRHTLSEFKYVIARAEPGFVFLPVVYVAQATVLRDVGRIGEALASLQKATELKPNYAHAYILSADILLSQNDRDGAVRVLKKGLSKTQGKAAASIKFRLNKLM